MPADRDDLMNLLVRMRTTLSPLERQQLDDLIDALSEEMSYTGALGFLQGVLCGIPDLESAGVTS